MVDPAPIQQNMPVGFRFRPTDEEIVGYYLQHKLLADDAFIHSVVPEIDLCKYEPWELPDAVSALSMYKSDDPEWFFFTPRDYKYRGSTRSNRATSCGYWKATGKDRNVRDRATNNVIGTKKTLVFYQGRPSVKTHWIIHEHHDAIFHPNQRTHVLCKLMNKSEKKATDKLDEPIYDEIEPNDPIATYEYENQANDYMIPVPYFSYMEDSMMTETPSESDDLGGSMIQTPLEVDSDTDSEGFDFRSLLRSSPSRDDEQE